MDASKSKPTLGLDAIATNSMLDPDASTPIPMLDLDASTPNLMLGMDVSWSIMELDTVVSRPNGGVGTATWTCPRLTRLLGLEHIRTQVGWSGCAP